MRRSPLPFLCLALTGCIGSLFESLPEEPPFPTGASFAYTAATYRYDTLLVGTITVLPADSGRFTGTWSLHWAPGADSTAWSVLPTGEGTLTGRITGPTQASVDLIGADTGRHILLGAFSDSAGWSGRWNYRDSLSGRPGGSFTARLLP